HGQLLLNFLGRSSALRVPRLAFRSRIQGSGGPTTPEALQRQTPHPFVVRRKDASGERARHQKESAPSRTWPCSRPDEAHLGCAEAPLKRLFERRPELLRGRRLAAHEVEGDLRELLRHLREP